MDFFASKLSALPPRGRTSSSILRNISKLLWEEILVSMGPQIGLAMLGLVFLAMPAMAQDVLTWHYDNARSGVQPHETVLVPANINASSFGKVFSFPIAGDALAQPLYLSQYLMLDGKKTMCMPSTRTETILPRDIYGAGHCSVPGRPGFPTQM